VGSLLGQEAGGGMAAGERATWRRTSRPWPWVRVVVGLSLTQAQSEVASAAAELALWLLFLLGDGAGSRHRAAEIVSIYSLGFLIYLFVFLAPVSQRFHVLCSARTQLHGLEPYMASYSHLGNGTETCHKCTHTYTHTNAHACSQRCTQTHMRYMHAHRHTHTHRRHHWLARIFLSPCLSGSHPVTPSLAPQHPAAPYSPYLSLKRPCSCLILFKNPMSLMTKALRPSAKKALKQVHG
jgi:hypothetical protein